MQGLTSVPGVRTLDDGRRRGPALLAQVDITLVVATVALMVYGIVMVWSASRARLRFNGADEMHFVKRQLVFLAVGIVLMVAVAAFDYRRYLSAAPALYGAAVLSLMLVLSPLGSTVNGARGWFVVGSFQVQPAEYAKPAIVLMLAAVAAAGEGVLDVRRVGMLIGVMAPPLALLVLQPDLGSTMVFVALTLGVLLVAGVKARHLIGLVLAGLLVVVGAFELGVVKEYQKKRLLTFIDPSSDSRRAGYNLLQSQIATGSGGVLGKGLGKGPQTNGGYVPEQHSDFIFAAVGEELGFVGCLSLIALLGLIVWRGVRGAQLARDFSGTMVAVGATTIIAFQAFLNIAVTIGVMPVTGVTLPLFSYGGSSVMATCMLVGLLLNVYMRRQTAAPLA